MLPLGREVQAERNSSLQAYRDGSKPVLGGRPAIVSIHDERNPGADATGVTRLRARQRMRPRFGD